MAFLAALPIMEIRGAIPIGLNYFDLPILPTFIFAVLGNIVPALLILVYLKPFQIFSEDGLSLINFFPGYLKERVDINRDMKNMVPYSYYSLLLYPFPVRGFGQVRQQPSCSGYDLVMLFS